MRRVDGLCGGMRRRIVEQRRVRHGRRPVEWVEVRRAGARGILFVPPLIGGLGVQQVRTFRPLIRRGYHLISFNYAGHGRSGDKFSLSTTLEDAADVLEVAGERAEALNLPLYGVGCCYGAIPLIHAAHQAAASGGGKRESPIRKIVLINAILGLDISAAVRSFWSYYRRDCPGTAIVEALERYLEFLFPGVRKSTVGFGELDRRRTRLFRTLAEAFSPDPLAAVRLTRTPNLCVYARHDSILSVYDSGPRSRYEKEIRRILPRTMFLPMKTDHFLTGTKERRHLCGAIAEFLCHTASDKFLIRP